MAISEEAIKELESRVGVEAQPLVYEIEKGLIRRFTAAVGDDNPLWQDETYAARSCYGGIITPPNLILTLGFGGLLEKYIDDPSVTVLHGSTELECHRQVMAGDIISAVASVKNVRQRQAEAGAMLFVTFDITYSNQLNEKVADCRQMVIMY